MTSEEKVIDKIRRLLIADSTLNGYTEKRVYASHISTIQNPAYPAISIHLLNARQDFNNRGFAAISLQIDVWFPFDQYNMSQVLVATERIRAILDRQNLTDSTIGLRVGQCVEETSGPIMVEEDVKLFHYPSIYNLVAL